MDEQMTQKSIPPKPVGSEAPGPDRDLSQEIERAVEREPLDLVKCVRVFGNCYRCNWWSHIGDRNNGLNPAWAGNLVDCVRKSRFLTASMQSGELVIKEVGSGDRENR